ncbi:hypothetical protein M1247_34635 [Mycobacterium sp. 21AC1]|uniref:hypothetical protein n=1 Tax=[Mycobacterium] appelbergii TaxID=2939269 RepID=UPI002938EEFE|nr:hypothetical protein [Mycobacterium sp. 21AC1]MDV3130084.1 hypothetical protein [Mycobacterium sp. 21AC1]
MDSSGPPPEALALMFEETMARARGRLAALEQACDDLAGRRDDPGYLGRRRQLLNGLACEFGDEQEAT